jgi:GTP-binding protein HflX
VSLIERSFRERIVLVGVTIPPETADETEDHLEELAQLIDTAGADEAARVVQRRDNPDPATYVGKGKAQELHEVSEEVDADTVVFDDELTPAQQRTLSSASRRVRWAPVRRARRSDPAVRARPSSKSTAGGWCGGCTSSSASSSS